MSSVLELVHQLQAQLDKSKLPLATLNSDDFDLEAFIKQCLSSKSSPSGAMQTLESELSAYLQESQSKVDALIHQDFENLLRIPKGLKDFDTRIQALNEKLSDVLGSVGGSLARLEGNKENAAALVDEIEKLNKEELRLEAQINTLENLDKVHSILIQHLPSEKWAVLERISRLTASNLSYTVFCPELKVKVQESAEAVQTVLETEMKRVLQAEQIPQRPLRCLFRCFSILQKQDRSIPHSGETLFREIVASPIVHDAIDLSLSLKTAKPDSLLSLSVCYKKIAREIAGGRLAAVADAAKWSGGSAVVMGLWKEIQSVLSATKALFTPSFAVEFRINFNETISFISTLRDYLPESDRHKLSFDGPLKPFLDKWNLAAYFVLRQSEVIKVLNQKLAASGDLKRLLLDQEKPATTFIKALDLLWSADYYIPFVATRFLRLHFQVLARYVTLIQQSHNKTEGVTATLLKDLILDVKSLERYLQTTFDSVLTALKVPLSTEVVTESIKLLGQITQPCTSSYMQLVMQQCTSNLQALRSIPGIYRMTNRPKPVAASSFADSFLRPLHESSKVITDPSVLTSMAESVADSFREMLGEVLEAISKSEQLFSKLKDTDESAQMDAEKMRMQLRLDAQGFVQGCAQWSLPHTHPTLSQILRLVSPRSS